MEYQTGQNPYYEGDIEICVQDTKGDKTIPNLNDIDIVTATQNIYYDL